MKTPTVLIGAAVIFGGVWFLWPDIPPTVSPEHAPESFYRHLGSDESSTPTEPVGVLDEPPARVVELNSELREEVEELRLQLAALQLEALRAEYLDDTPYGAFLHSYEAEQITDTLERDQVKYALDEISVMLQPGEATWLAERHRNNDWKGFGETRDEAMIRFFGGARVLATVTPEKLATYKEWYDESEWLALFGTPKPQ